ncbi:protein translocase subunit SecD [Paenibacillus sp. GP183]|jgi:SecD/SecF fusion protein|uniref:protein translocase subunit SecD n=1 Tax=Paenibacillus sp. GP183 TaxID=1882751 RepID=UPI000896E41F|nr:protein translocase subunit SecD [Paenibacillus sp. GP183]SEC43037.1 protein translocase subunit secF /protein translocase subunit secD [Paenibacillus sp. GP183]
MINFKKLTLLMVILVFMATLVLTTSSKITNNIKLGLDLKGGFETLYQASPIEGNKPVTHEALVQTAKSLIDRIGRTTGYVAEPDVTVEGNDHIRVKLAGIEKPDEVRQILSKPAELSFRGPNGKKEMLGNDFVENAAKVGFNPQTNQPYIIIKTKDINKFKDVTTRLLGKPLSIYLDDQELSSPAIRNVITNGEATIEGSFTYDKAKNIADTINLGALPLKLSEKYIQKVDPNLGQMSLEKTIKFGIIASLVILIFMLCIYRTPGLVANICIISYAWLLLLVFFLMKATLTLPGIAAFVLGIGMAVDANIITFERIKEEIHSGKSLSSALIAGSRHSFRTIIDAHVTTIIAGAVLYWLGNGAVKGFALTLILSILVSILSNVFFSRFLLNLLIRINLINNPVFFGVRDSNNKDRFLFNIVKHRRKFFILSGTITLIGLLSLTIWGFNFGVDFKAGTNLDISLGKTVEKSQIEKIIQSTGTIKEDSVNVGQGGHTTVRFGKILDQFEVDRLKSAITNTFGNQVSFEENKVSPDIAQELGKNAIITVLIASLGILIYITIRFEWRFAIAAILALLHDVFIVISLFSILRLEVNLTFIAAVLTIIGYSINDTVVIFDRIRENLRFSKLRSFNDLEILVNNSIRQTMTRSIYTVVTVFIAAISLYFGSESIRLFSLAMIFGLISGAYSSIFIASPIWLLLKNSRNVKSQLDNKKVNVD